MTNLTIVELPRKNRAKRLKRGQGRKKKKNKGLTLRKADALFSAQIKARDGKCLHPDSRHAGSLQNSHYIGRGTKSTRFDPDNCITLCWWHHFKSKDLGWEYQKQTLEKHGFDGQYTLFMKKRLGEEKWQQLQERAKLFMSQKAAIKAFEQALLATLSR